jgi:hypothetical protein
MMRYLRFLLPVVSLLGVLPAACPAEDQAAKGFEPLFNGMDLTGWTVLGGKKDVWGADHGILFVDGKGGGWLMTEREFGDFEVRLDFKMPRAGNSGVALRAPLMGNPAYDGMEIQLLDDPWYKDEKNYKGLRPTQLTGSIYDVVPPARDALKPVGEWNTIHITAKGRQVTVELNGVKTVDANLDDHKDRADKHPGLWRAKGHLGLQSHDGRVEFRNLLVKPL